VLAPELRNPDGAREVLIRLTSKAAARLRTKELVASHIRVSAKYGSEVWSDGRRLNGASDSITIVSAATDLWKGCSFASPRHVGVTLSELSNLNLTTPSLFDERLEQRDKLSRAIDDVNQKIGKNSVYLGAMARAKDTASEKIAFQKTWLFQEGKADNEWVDTRRAKSDSRKD
jgi:DNA polymerase-4